MDALGVAGGGNNEKTRCDDENQGDAARDADGPIEEGSHEGGSFQRNAAQGGVEARISWVGGGGRIA